MQRICCFRSRIRQIASSGVIGQGFSGRAAPRAEIIVSTFEYKFSLVGQSRTTTPSGKVSSPGPEPLSPRRSSRPLLPFLVWADMFWTRHRIDKLDNIYPSSGD